MAADSKSKKPVVINIENARLAFRNFSGKEGTFNPAGRRNFCVFLDSKVAEDLTKMGWNIRWLKPRNPEDETQAYLQVAVSYKAIPPKIVLITKRNKTTMAESSIHILDWAEMENVDLVVRQYNWKFPSKEGEKTGVKAYLKTMYVTLVEDEFESKYVDVPDAAIASLDLDD